MSRVKKCKYTQVTVKINTVHSVLMNYILLNIAGEQSEQEGEKYWWFCHSLHEISMVILGQI